MKWLYVKTRYHVMTSFTSSLSRKFWPAKFFFFFVYKKRGISMLIHWMNNLIVHYRCVGAAPGLNNQTHFLIIPSHIVVSLAPYKFIYGFIMVTNYFHPKSELQKDFQKRWEILSH